MTNGQICVFGGAHIDRRGRISGTTAAGASNPGAWFVEAGGGGFNAARNLARLGHRVHMISARGGDADGETVAQAAEAAGVIDCPFTFLDRKTPSYTAILESDGNLVIALADMDLYRLFSPRRLRQRAMRDLLAGCAMVIADANLPSETITSLVSAATAQNKIVAGIAISPAKVTRYSACLDGLTFLFMNQAEARALIGGDVEAAEEWPVRLRAAGLNGGVVTRGGEPAIAFHGMHSVSVAPPSLEALGDVTGAGDALAAGFLSAHANGADLASSLRHGIAAAGITVGSALAVSEKISQQAVLETIGLVPPAKTLS
ncbi:carbohydrate kinase family protein [Pararhizobium antarcticum]|uniref:Carbohydrate kinase n=1 Tax=Pararhizobium antarcticum TaxID=1798805 RepID=A0A657LNW6_9HYPH|nr:carbohydrate kinase family protein [Pararhizobium antarcticum]OJF93394.1 carbohydrate kinase [Pararhizobium antarcticum]OJF95970.1 carbohydrate kinase [Rhizobium sp. 58]